MNIDKLLKKALNKSSFLSHQHQNMIGSQPKTPVRAAPFFIKQPKIISGMSANSLMQAKILNNMMQGVRPHFGKNDNDGDGWNNKIDCQPNNPFRQDMLLALGNKNNKSGLYMKPEKPNVIYIASMGKMINKNPTNEDIALMSNSIGHEEIHGVMAKQKRHIANSGFDYITKPILKEGTNKLTASMPMTREEKHQFITNLKPHQKISYDNYLDSINKRTNEIRQEQKSPATLGIQKPIRRPSFFRPTDEKWVNVSDWSKISPEEKKEIDRNELIIAAEKHRRDNQPDYLKILNDPETEVMAKEKQANINREKYRFNLKEKYYMADKGSGERENINNELILMNLHDRGELMDVPEERDISKGASIAKQQEWKDMPEEQKAVERATSKDTDGDNTPDEYDCKPDNPDKQDTIYSIRPYKEKFAKKIIPTDMDQDYYYDEKTGKATKSKYPHMRGRDTGWFGTGIYGFRTREQAEQYQTEFGPNAGHLGYIREFEIKKPFKPKTDYQSQQLHDASKELYYAKTPREYNLARISLGFAGISTTPQELKTAKRIAGRTGEQPINALLRKKGYDGVIPTDKYQNTSYGSVMYAYKPEQIKLDKQPFTEEQLKAKREYQKQQEKEAIREQQRKKEEFESSIMQIAAKPTPITGEILSEKTVKERGLNIDQLEREKNKWGEIDYYTEYTPEEKEAAAKKYYGDNYTSFKNIQSTFEQMDKGDTDGMQEKEEEIKDET